MAGEFDDDQSIVEVEFVLERSQYPFVRASEEFDCRFELAGMVPRPDGRFAEFYNVTDADPARVATAVTDHDGVDVTHLRRYDSGGLVEFLVSEDCPAYSLATHGALPREVRSTEGVGRIVVEIPSRYDPSTVIESFLAEHPEASLATKREKGAITPLFTRSTFQQVILTRLTERQREVLRTAYEAGYYDWPRQCTGEELADELGISSATFSEHIAAAERKILCVTFEGPE